MDNETENSINLTTQIIDTGIGLTKEQQAVIFNAFTQATESTTRLYGVTGLGLSIVKKFIAAMNTEIHIDSKVGFGSNFYFKLNLQKAQNNIENTVDIKKQHQLKGKKILLVEDNQINILVGKQILAKEQMDIDITLNGQIAVDKVKENIYDIVLTDIQMPIMDGYTATREIRKFNITIPILALSASVFMEVKNKILESGMNGFIHKPFETEDLLAELDKQINGNASDLETTKEAS